MKILYVGNLSPNDSTLYRMWALQRLGETPIPIDALGYAHKSALARKIAFRLAAGPEVQRLNRDILRIAENNRVDALWADKVLGMQPRTLDRLRQLGIVTVSYMIDNAFGPRRDPGWRLYMRSLGHYDLHITQRDVSLREYQRRGARDTLKIQTAFEPTLHFAPPPGWSDRDRDRGVSFIGSPYDQRAAFLTRLADDGVPVSISGAPVWQRALPPEVHARLFREGELYQQQYRQAIWRSKINLSFLTHSNQDEFVHKSFEIAACKGFLLAERSPGHSERFVEDREAVFFSTYEECLEKIRRYLPDEPARTRIAEAGYQRALGSGYGNDRQVEIIVERIRFLLAQRRDHAPAPAP